jgi:Tol biopolymer transport system component
VATALAGTASGGRLEAAPWVRLSEGEAFSDVEALSLSPGARWAIYREDAEIDGTGALWSVETSGGTPHQLSGPLLPGTSIVGYRVSADGATVIYAAALDTPGVTELYSVPIGGGDSTKLNGPLVAGGNVTNPGFEISPDGQRVIYRADQETDGVLELYSVAIGGGPVTKLNGPLVPGGLLRRAEVLAGGARVVYMADQETAGVVELYSVPIAGGAAVKLNGALDPGSYVREFELSPDGAWVVYQAGSTTLEIYSVPAAGGVATRLNGALVAGGGVQSWRIAPDSQRVAYRADQLTHGVFELFSVPIGGGTAIKLSGALVAGGNVAAFEFAPFGARLVFYADKQVDGVIELYSVAASGGSVTKLNDPLVAGGNVQRFEISADGAWVVYLADQEVDGWNTGHRVPIAGPAGSAETIWTRAVTSGSLRPFAIDLSRGRVIVRGNEAFVDGIVRLWSFPLLGTPDPDGGEELVAAADFPAGGDVTDFRLGPEGTIVYLADQEVDEQIDLYSLPKWIFWDDFESGDSSRWSVP